VDDFAEIAIAFATLPQGSDEERLLILAKRLDAAVALLKGDVATLAQQLLQDPSPDPQVQRFLLATLARPRRMKRRSRMAELQRAQIAFAVLALTKDGSKQEAAIQAVMQQRGLSRATVYSALAIVRDALGVQRNTESAGPSSSRRPSR
jgi:hypothetical protein